MTRPLAYTDPRLLMQAMPADPESAVTRVALNILTDALGMSRDRVVCASAFGLPVRLIVVRKGDIFHYFLNPVLKSAGDFYIHWAEMGLHTGTIRRNVRRARKIQLWGTDLTGRLVTLDLENSMAYEAQQALELLNMPDPFYWMTPYHHLWQRLARKDEAGYYESINVGLYTRDEKLRFDQQNGVTLYSSNEGQPLCRFNALNPMDPVDIRHRALLALLLALTGLQHVFMADSENLPVVVAGLLVANAMTVHVEAGVWPKEILSRFGVLRAFREYTFRIEELSAGHTFVDPLDAVVIDRIARPGLLPDQATLHKIAQALSGSGSLLIALPTEDQKMENHLQSAFSELLLFPFATGGIVYVARKSYTDPALLRANLLAMGVTTGIDLSDALPETWLHLRKDQRRKPI